MKWPQQVTPSDPSRIGQAPYNFVPLPERIFEIKSADLPDHDHLVTERRHGQIDLEITTLTETYTRCAYPLACEGEDVAASPERQDFYHHGQPLEPVLPGSTLRGMVRNLVEILSYSRLSRRPEPGQARIADRALVFRSVADQVTSVGRTYNDLFLRRRGHLEFDYPHPNVRAGYLEKASGHGWQIRPAQFLPAGVDRSKQSTFARISTLKLPKDLQAPNTATRDLWIQPEEVRLSAKKVKLWYARPAEISLTGKPGWIAGRLVCSGDIPTRHMHTIVYPPDPQAPPLLISDELWSLYHIDSRLQRDPERGVRRLGKAGDALFYLVDSQGKLVFFGPTIFFRVPYECLTGDFLPALTAGGLDDSLDVAEAIFGTVNGDRGALKGRISFDDAVMVKDGGSTSPFLPGSEGRRWLGILSAPKPTSYQNYLVQTSPDGAKALLHSYNKISLDKTVLRGFKRYWHRAGPDEAHLRPTQPDTGTSQYTVVRPVRPGINFAGRIHFENLSELELGALLAALELPSSCRHHVGMGKPLGLGSVRVTSNLFLYNPKERYRSLLSTGRLSPEATGPLHESAQEAFRMAMVGHHNQTVTSGQLPLHAELWEIPRLKALRYLLEWDKPPHRKKTTYLEKEASRERQVLPTPAAVAGDTDPNVQAIVPAAPSEAKLAIPVVCVSARKVMERPVVSETRTGRLVEFRYSGVRLLLDGESAPRLEQLDARKFPTESWGKLDGNHLTANCAIQVELDAGGKVLRVLRK